MPIATPEQYRQMLGAAHRGRYAFPALNISSMVTANAALKGLADKRSDGILQVSTGAGKFASGTNVQDKVLGAICIAEHIHRVADRYDILIGLHTDHCQPQEAESFLDPLIKESEQRVARKRPPLFNSHMVDASTLKLQENLDFCLPIYKRLAQLDMIIEIEVGHVGGEEDGAASGKDLPPEKLYTSAEQLMQTYKQMREIKGTYLLAATFGNVHGHYKPGTVKLRPEILKDGLAAVQKEFGDDAYFYYVFHGGSGSENQQIKETLKYGVVKMNVDTDNQYAFTREIVGHMFANYDKVLMVDGNVGDKKFYDPRSYLGLAEKAMAQRVSQACDDLESTGKSIR